VTAATVSRWARRYVLAGAGSLTAWQAGVVVGIPRRTGVVLGLLGFVLHVVFGKAYSLVPAYFDRNLAFPRAPAVQFPLTVGGVSGLVAASLDVGPSWTGAAGALLWTLGVGAFVVTLGWTIRENPTGRETATGDHNADRRPVDRLANGFVPVALLYLLAGTYETLALSADVPPLLGGYPPQATHLLAAGTAGVLLFSLGFRLLPRFMVAHPPRWLVGVVLLTGASGPALLAAGLPGGGLFRVGAVVEAVAVVGYAVAVGTLYRRSERRRVGFVGVLASAVFGVAGVALGFWFAFGRPRPSLAVAHLRLNLLGFLGLAVVGVSYQFYPPSVGRLPAASDRTALVSIAALASGLVARLAGRVVPVVATFGHLLAFGGAVLYAYLLVAAFRAR
jgi:hypothetical protein